MKAASFLVIFLFSFNLFASGASLLNLSQQDFDEISEEFASNFSYRSVLGAEPLGEIFGFEVGILGGSQESAKLNSLSKASGGSGVSSLYHANLVAAVSLPFGITIEGVVFPKTTLGDFEYSNLGLAGKLTLNADLLKVLPFNLALRAFTQKAKMSYSQDIPSVGSAVVESEISSNGVQVLLSPDLPMVEPYVGLGSIRSQVDLKSSQGSIFADGSPSKSSSQSSSQVILGVNANILVFHLGAEYTQSFHQNAYTFKFGFGF